jgi:hypothetical protein
MRAQLAVDVVMVTLAKQIEILLGELRCEVVGIVLRHDRAIRITDSQEVGPQGAPSRKHALEQTTRMQASHGPGLGQCFVFRVHRNAVGIRLKYAHDTDRRCAGTPGLVCQFVIAEQRSRLAMGGADQSRDLVLGQ